MALNFYFLKNTEILKLKFRDFSNINFLQNFRDCRGLDTLSMYKVIGSFDLRENLRVKFSKIWLGALSPRG